MKLTSLFLFLSLLCLKASCQSFTPDDLAAMLNKQDNATYLVARGFILCKDCYSEPPVPIFYQKNKDAANAEVVSLFADSFEYSCRDLASITAVLNQAKAKYKLLKSDTFEHQGSNDETFTRTTFTDGKINLLFMVFKKSGWVTVSAQK